jgi:hypothetical protein
MKKFTLALLLLCASPVLCAEIKVYNKDFFTVLVPASYNDTGAVFKDETIFSLNNRTRLSSSLGINSSFSVISAYEISLRHQSPSISATGLDLSANTAGNASYRVTDLRARLHPESDNSALKTGVFQNLDRLFVKYRASSFDAYIGRQAVSWGSAHVISPMDVIVPYRADSLDTEERYGVDAVRVRFPSGMAGELDMGYIFGEDALPENSAAFVRGKAYVEKTDVSLLAMKFKDNVLLGFDLTRGIGGAGFWWESAYVLVDGLASGVQRADDYFRSSVGFDYSFTGELYSYIEYHYNGAGTCDAGKYLAKSQGPAFTEGAVYLLGESYIAPGAAYTLTPLISLSGQLLSNLNDSSMLATLNCEYNIFENMYVSAGGYSGIGEKSGRLQAGPFTLYDVKSEFGTYPQVLYSSFRVYF